MGAKVGRRGSFPESSQDRHLRELSDLLSRNSPARHIAFARGDFCELSELRAAERLSGDRDARAESIGKNAAAIRNSPIWDFRKKKADATSISADDMGGLADAVDLAFARTERPDRRQTTA